jgi:hypothetical protein|eukprot:4935673-Prymnesium_polylepis.1
MRSEGVCDAQVRCHRGARRVRRALGVDLLCVHEEVGDLAARGIPPDLDYHLERHPLDRARLGANLGRRLGCS